MSSPFDGVPTEERAAKRDELIEEHPLTPSEIRRLVLNSFDSLRKTRIGNPDDEIRIYRDVPVGAQTSGAFLETIIANKLNSIDSNWEQGSDAEKDLIHTENPWNSTEVKFSGQINDEVFGNRSFGQEVKTEEKKKKSGYYITVNSHITEEFLSPSYKPFLIRFGWIDFNDWIPQGSSTGQAAKLSDEVYQNKLRVIPGEYMKNAPVEFMNRIGPAKLESAKPFLDQHDIITMGEFMEAYESSGRSESDLDKIYSACQSYPGNRITMGKDDIDLFGDSEHI